MHSFFTYLTEHTSFIMQFVVYGLLAMYLYMVLKPQKKAVLEDVLQDTETSLNKQDRRLLKMANHPLIQLLIPKENSSSYQKMQKTFSSIHGMTKYKTLHLFFIERAYNTILTFISIVILMCAPYLMYIIQGWLGVENPILFPFPPAFLGLLLLAPVLIYGYPSLEIKTHINKQKIALEKEVISLGIMVQTMLETGNSPYDILVMLKDIKPAYKNFIEVALNEYYVDTKQALENLKTRVGLVEFDMIVDTLIYAYETDNMYASKFLNEYITRLEQTTKISSEKSNKLKPYLLLMASIPPLVAALVLWFYPWVMSATENLSTQMF